MIKTVNGETTINGTKSDLMSDFAMITRALVKALVQNGSTEEEAWEEVEMSFLLAKKPSEEVKEEILEMVKKLLDKAMEE